MEGSVYFGDNLEVLKKFSNASVDLIYIDPPFNTGRTQARRTQIKIVYDHSGNRNGFKGNKYQPVRLGASSYADKFTDYPAFIEPRLKEAYRLLKPNGSLFFHIDCREVHYCKVMLDSIFGRESFINEIIWAYDYGARATCKWSTKHDNILWYAKDPENYTYRYDDIDRIPYMAPELAGPEKAARGKTPTDVWWNTIVSPTGREKTGYPTQKPLAIIKRIVAVHSNPGDLVMDFFAGSGTLGAAALALNRNFVLIDSNPDAIEIIKRRFDGLEGITYG